MKHPKRSILFALLAAGASLALGAPTALAQHEHGAPPHAHGPAAKAPATFKDAVKAIHDRLAEVGEAIEKGDLDAAHDEADAAGEIGKGLGALALKADSGVPKDKVKDVNNAGKELAAQAEALHEAVEKKDKAGVQAAYGKMNKALESLGQFVAASYVCPMHCEGSKTYPAPGKCPVCGMNLKKVTSDKYSAMVKPAGGKVEAGKPVSLTFTLKDPAGAPVTKVETVHEKLLHLLIVSKDLAWFAHEHPAVQPDGTFSLSFTFPAGGEYILYHDFTPPGVGQQVVQTPLTVEGKAAAAVKLTVDDKAPKTIDGYSVTLDTGGPVKTGGETHLAFTITKDGKPVTTLAPYLGAMGHLVVISEDLKEFVHSHPHEEGAEHASGATGPKVDFEAHFAKPGVYKGWGQFNVGTKEKEKIVTAPFTFTVAKGEGAEGGHDDHGKKPDHDHGK